jgi:hypothetical protein
MADPTVAKAGVAAVGLPGTSDISAHSGELRAARRPLVRREMNCRIDRKRLISGLRQSCRF